MNNINLEWYKVFCNVVKFGNITKAAEFMYISQSAITQSINKLEKQLGGILFVRNKRGVELTTEGKALYDYIIKSIDVMDNAENVFSQYSKLEKGTIRIGSSNTLAKEYLINVISAFSKEYPNITFSIVNNKTVDMMYKLSIGAIDIVLMYLPFNDKDYPDINIELLSVVKDCFYTTKEYLKSRSIKKLSDLENEDLILPNVDTNRRKSFDEFCMTNGVCLNGKYEASSLSIIRELVLQNLGIGFDEENGIKDLLKNKKVLKLPIKLPTKDICYATLDKKIISQATLKFITYLKKYN